MSDDVVTNRKRRAQKSDAFVPGRRPARSDRRRRGRNPRLTCTRGTIMKNEKSKRQHCSGAVSLTIGIAAIALAVTAAPAQAGDADKITPPHVPGNIHVDPPDEIFLVGHAVGTQNYVCLPSGSTVAWTLFTPQATLFTDRGKQLITHFFSPNPTPNPAEHGIVRATWQDSK